MERSVTPWREIDAEAALTDPDAGRAGREVSGGSPPWRAWPVLGGLAAAVALGIAALGVVASGPTPVAIVQADAAPVAAGGGTPVPGSPAVAAPAPADIVVHVAGAVRRPGIVTIPAGSRVADAIEAAGGLGPRVDAARLGTEVNLASVVADGERVVVPSRDDTAATTGSGTGGAAGGGASAGSAGGSSGGSASGGPVDLNSATAEALEALPGIGEVTAAKIVEARTERPFRSVDELLERKVVGAATLAKFRDLVVVR